ncbi:hypothetical protein CYY_003416 [Polysphondylium violaceum]|uniref:Cyclin-like domain-containing protein n=1 Tax=Polysphondylium violaceum TaxID=133409 RepID=A0A8J4V5Y3_9MYCE|nr:hypothetical protein CYY_003416 [Polysphondylium violaceum]
MSKAAFNFLSNISLTSSSSGTNSGGSSGSGSSSSKKEEKKPPSSSSSSSSKTTTTTTTTTSSSSSAKSSTSSSSSSSKLKTSSQNTTFNHQHSHSWIFNLPYQSFKSLREIKLNSRVKLKIKLQQVSLKKGDRFYFSVSSPTTTTTSESKGDRIVCSSIVIIDPTEVQDENTTEVVVQFEKVFNDPIPRTVFASYPTLHDLAISKSTFTKISDSQLQLFSDVLLNYSSKVAKKEAVSFLSGISLGDINSSSKSSNKNESPSMSSNITTSRNDLGALLDNNVIDNNEKRDILTTSSSTSTANTRRDTDSDLIKTSNNELVNRTKSKDNIITTTAAVNSTPKEGFQPPSFNRPPLPPSLLTEINDLLNKNNHQHQPPPQQPNNNNINTSGGSNLLVASNTNSNSVTTSAESKSDFDDAKSHLTVLKEELYYDRLNNSNNSVTAGGDVYSSQQLVKKQKRSTIEEYNQQYNLAFQQKIFLVTPSGHPFYVFSMIRGESRKPKKGGKKGEKDPDMLGSRSNSNVLHSSGMNIDGEILHHHKEHKKNRSDEVSYAHLINSTHQQLQNLVGDEVDMNGIPLKYNPGFLDNSDLKTGKHRTVIYLPSYKISIFPFIKKGAIKEELNEQFRQKHQWITQPSMTLSKIRKMKRKLKKISILSGFEVSTLALSYVLLEKLIIKNMISKPNFRLYGAACLLLAAKFNDTKAFDRELSDFFEAVEKKFSISKKDLIHAEFLVFTHVSFGLFVDFHEVLPHLNRLKSESIDDDKGFIM